MGESWLGVAKHLCMKFQKDTSQSDSIRESLNPIGTEVGSASLEKGIVNGPPAFY
jgi:hypothetical protein